MRSEIIAQRAIVQLPIVLPIVPAALLRLTFSSEWAPRDKARSRICSPFRSWVGVRRAMPVERKSRADSELAAFREKSPRSCKRKWGRVQSEIILGLASLDTAEQRQAVGHCTARTAPK